METSRDHRCLEWQLIHPASEGYPFAQATHVLLHIHVLRPSTCHGLTAPYQSGVYAEYQISKIIARVLSSRISYNVSSTWWIGNTSHANALQDLKRLRVHIVR